MSNAIIWWILASSLITIVHTGDESEDIIWETLGIDLRMYFSFQLFVLALGAFPVAWQLFVAVRLVDVILTHMILNKPGTRTAPLLVLDALVVGWLHLG